MKADKRRVVITGIGILAPGSSDTAAFWKNALDGAAVIETIPERWLLYFTPYSRLIAPLPSIDWALYPISRIEAMQLDMTAKLAVAAAWQAIHHAGLEPLVRDEKKNTFALKNIDPSRAGVFLGTGMGGICSFAANEGHHLYAPLKQAAASGLPFVQYAQKFNPFAVPMSMPNGASARSV